MFGIAAEGVCKILAGSVQIKIQGIETNSQAYQVSLPQGLLCMHSWATGLKLGFEFFLAVAFCTSQSNTKTSVFFYEHYFPFVLSNKAHSHYNQILKELQDINRCLVVKAREKLPIGVTDL